MAVVTTGFFDGVHLGHRLVIDKLVSLAHGRGELAEVLTLWPHPRVVLQKDARDLRLLTSLEEKKDLLSSLGVDKVHVLPFTREFSRMDAGSYVRDILAGKIKASTVLLGYDNRIGSDSLSGESVRALCEAKGLECILLPSVSEGEKAISSTRIRETLSQGDIAGAAAMLGYDYSLDGVVVGGDKRGRQMGFPTANLLRREPLKLVPGNGVYLVRVGLGDRKFYGMCNVGVRPTVGGRTRTIETNIFDFDEDIYGMDMRVTFLRRIREERCFGSVGELSSQLCRDRIICMEEIESLSCRV